MRFAFLPLSSLLLLSAMAAQISSVSTENQAPPLGSVSGEVLQAPGGMPVGKVMVSLVSSRGVEFSFARRDPNRLSGLTDAEGRFRIKGVPAGEYQVSLEKTGFVAGGRTSQKDSSQRISLAQGQQLDGLLFRVLPAGVIMGKIIDAQGDPLGNVHVAAVSMAGISGGAETNDLGEYRIAGLSSGKYFVLAQATDAAPPAQKTNEAGRVFAPTFFPGTMNRGQAVSLDLHPGDAAEASFGLITTRTFSVRGQVATVPGPSRNGQNPRPAAVTLRPGGMPLVTEFSGEIKKDGTFEISGVVPGTYDVSITSPDGDSLRPVRGTDIVEVRESDVDDLRLAPQPLGEVHGRIRMDDNEPFNWTQLNVSLDSDDGDQDSYLSVNVAKDGTFKIESVPVGNYDVVVSAGSNNLRDYFVKEVNVNGADAADSGFATGPGISMVEVVASARGGTIVGTVVDGDNKTVSDVQVFCAPDASRQKRPDVYQQVLTDRRGQFSLRGLNSGDYTVFVLNGEPSDVNDPDFFQAHETEGQSVRLNEGEQKTLTLKFSWNSTP
jgi:Carboxypeptidase regulatory-like domain